MTFINSTDSIYSDTAKAFMDIIIKFFLLEKYNVIGKSLRIIPALESHCELSWVGFI